MQYYAVANGRNTGIFHTWDECNAQVKGFRGAIYKKFTKEADATHFIESNQKTSTDNQKTLSGDIINRVPIDYYVYTDGACVHNGKPNASAGYGIYFGENDSRNVSARVAPGSVQTNNVAELTAILHTYPIIESDIRAGKHIMIVSDSVYALRCVGDYGKRCHCQGWAKDIPNKELVKETYEKYVGRENVKFMYIAAHTNHTDVHSIGNSHADMLANNAIGLDACPYNNNT